MRSSEGSASWSVEKTSQAIDLYLSSPNKLGTRIGHARNDARAPTCQKPFTRTGVGDVFVEGVTPSPRLPW